MFPWNSQAFHILTFTSSTEAHAYMYASGTVRNLKSQWKAYLAIILHYRHFSIMKTSRRIIVNSSDVLRLYPLHVYRGFPYEASVGLGFEVTPT